MKNTIALVLGGGQGTRLYPLTKYRSKPAVPLAAKYRLIDIPLSNCINSGVNRIYVLTQFMSVSLHRHIRRTYRFDHFNGGFVELLAAQQTIDQGTDWYQGTADAVRKNLRYIAQRDIEHVLILSGDQLYRMDYVEMLRTHKSANAEVTIAALPVDSSEASSLGVMRCDDDGRVRGFLEKPQTVDELDIVRTSTEWIDAQGIESRGRDCLASMGIYLFNRDTLLDVLEKTDYEDFGKEVFPASIRSRHVQMHLFDDYWEDIGTIRAFYDANLNLAGTAPPFDLTNPGSPIYTHARYLPPTQMASGVKISGSLIADGCRIGANATIDNSVIGLRCVIGENAHIRNSIIMGADYYESVSTDRIQVPLGIGSGSKLDGVIVDKNCRIGQRVDIQVPQEAADSDDADVMIRDGVAVVVKEATLPDGWKLTE
ncbi:MAG TPA: glucose-1-phosphate adenylyltransferase [Planctomycetes bacterium]|nr:glucose-1-phosphate adenylyltransferase [Planctomycetota bacterium]